MNMMTSDAVWRRFLGNLKDYAILFLDADGTIAAWSEGARILTGYTAQEIVGAHFSCLATPEARAAGHPERMLVAAAAGSYEEAGWRVRKDQSRFQAHVTISAIHDGGALRGFGTVLRAISGSATEDSNITKLLEYTACTDYTGIANHRSFDTMLLSAIAAARRHRRPICVAIIALDKFKAYKEDFGRQEGEIYLAQASHKWRAAMRAEDFIGRHGDEFMVILPDTVLEDAAICLERVRRATPPPLTCTVGMSQWNGEEPPAALLARAQARQATGEIAPPPDRRTPRAAKAPT